MLRYKIIPRSLNWIFALIIVYTMGCLYQAQNMSTEMIALSATVSDSDGKNIRPLESFQNAKVKRGERVTVSFRVPARSVSGWNHIERHLIDSSNSEIIVSVMDRKWSANSPFVVKGEFPIPRHAAPGCGAAIFSKSYYSINWNILTWLVPMVGVSPKVILCIE